MRAPPPDFRYVGLAIDDRGPAARAAVPAATAAVLVGAAVHGGVVEVACVGAAALATLDLVRRIVARRSAPRSFAIVPWGVLVSASGDLRTLPWSSVTDVRVEARHRKDEGEALVTGTTVIVQTAREVFRGTASGPVGLESLVANVSRWADEASCPVATDLHGESPLSVEPAEPRFGELAAAAEELAEQLGGSSTKALPFGYRGASDSAAWRECSDRLRFILRSRVPSAADPRPLSALVAARLGAVACVPDLLRLVSAPSGFLSLAAKAAALRLGAPLERAGSLDEVAPFVPPEDLAAAGAFVEPSAQALAQHLV